VQAAEIPRRLLYSAAITSRDSRLRMYNLARQMLFKLSPETSHELSLDLIGAGGRLGINRLLSKSPASLPVRVMGIDFPEPGRARRRPGQER